MFLYVEIFNDLNMYSIIEIYIMFKMYFGENVIKGQIFLYIINVRDYMYLIILKLNDIYIYYIYQINVNCLKYVMFCIVICNF